MKPEPPMMPTFFMSLKFDLSPKISSYCLSGFPFSFQSVILSGCSNGFLRHTDFAFI
jgi:hypothetical protein